jgi:plasmid stabilization system protein ParE
MEYAVELTGRAERDLKKLLEYIEVLNSPSARRWFNGLEKAIYGLDRFPRRCSLAREARKEGHPIRQLLYGKKPGVYRVLFEIQELTRRVRVLAIRHGARDEWNRKKSS